MPRPLVNEHRCNADRFCQFGLGNAGFEVCSKFHKEKFSAALNAMSSAPLIAFFSTTLFNGDMMTIDEIRRQNLESLLGEFGSVAAFAEKIGLNGASQVSQWRHSSPDSKTGKPRAISTATARQIEKACDKPIGWMDNVHPRERLKEEQQILNFYWNLPNDEARRGLRLWFSLAGKIHDRRVKAIPVELDRRKNGSSPNNP